MSAPTSLTGYLDEGAFDLDMYGATVDYLLDNVPALMHPTSVYSYARMRHEPQLAAVLRVYLLALERGNWTVNGAGCRDEVTARISNDLGLPIKGYNEPDPDDTEYSPGAMDAAMAPSGARRRKFTWSKHLPLAAGLSLTFGHAPFAQQWDQGPDRLWQLGMVQERMPQTIAARYLNPDGTLKGVQQGAGMQNTPIITTANHELIWYCREREGSNYWGQSLLRPSYGPWLIKDQMLRVLATSNRRWGMGVPYIEDQPGATPQQSAENARWTQRLQASERMGGSVPNGATLRLAGLSGTVPDTLGFITYLDRLMTRSALTSILDMATAERGARSLGETVMQLMIYAQQAEAARIAVDGTEQIVIPLVDANFGENENVPTIEVDDVGIDDVLTAQDLNWLLEYGGINPDDTLEEDLRKRKHLPPIDHATRRIEITEQPPTPVGAPVDPNAPDSTEEP